MNKGQWFYSRFYNSIPVFSSIYRRILIEMGLWKGREEDGEVEGDRGPDTNA